MQPRAGGRRAGVVIAALWLGAYGGGAAPALEEDASTAAHGPARFAVLIAGDQDAGQLRAVVASLHPRAEVEALFPDEFADDTMRRSFLVLVPDLAPDAAGWDEAYRLRDAGKFDAVHPDRPDTLEVQTRAELADLRCFSNPGVEAPADPAWSLVQIQVPAAAALPPAPGGRADGVGIRVCHPDTGWAEHVELDADRLDLDSAFDLIDRDGDATDPLDYDFPLAARGHGTATGSVIISGPAGVFSGVAPRATLVPIRTMRSVVRVLDSRVARAVAHARRVGCDVVSMSLGGAGFFGLHAVVKRAVRDGIIVVAAAGNCVRLVVAPALYPEAIAVAATNGLEEPWHGSCRGPAVDVSAPGEDVYRAKRDVPGEPTSIVEPSDGTSYAVAHVAGAAARWLAHHGRPAIEAARQPGETVNDVFRRLVVATAKPPTNWNAAEMGAGILDVAALLRADLSLGRTLDLPPTGARADDDVMLLALRLGVAPDRLRGRLAERFDAGVDPARYAAELLELSLRDPVGVAGLLGVDSPVGDVPPDAPVRARQRASERLRADLR